MLYLILLIALPFIVFVGTLAMARRHQKEAEQQQAIQSHSVEIIVQDSGGYRVVE